MKIRIVLFLLFLIKSASTLAPSILGAPTSIFLSSPYARISLNSILVSGFESGSFSIFNIYIKAGNGGDGSPSFRREKYVEFGGPDGGDGGRGGSIILKSEENLNTLIDYRYQQHHKAQRGENGSGQNRTGKSGAPLLPVRF